MKAPVGTELEGDSASNYSNDQTNIYNLNLAKLTLLNNIGFFSFVNNDPLGKNYESLFEINAPMSQEKNGKKKCLKSNMHFP